MHVEATEDLTDLAWLARRAGIVVTEALKAIKVVDGAGTIHGMVGYDSWTPGACAIHIALASPAALRHLIHTGFAVPFLVHRKQALIATVLSTNRRSLKLVRHLGFREAGRIRNGWAKGVSLVLFEMQREDCRFIPQEARDGTGDGREGRSSAAGVLGHGATGHPSRG